MAGQSTPITTRNSKLPNFPIQEIENPTYNPVPPMRATLERTRVNREHIVMIARAVKAHLEELRRTTEDTEKTLQISIEHLPSSIAASLRETLAKEIAENICQNQEFINRIVLSVLAKLEEKSSQTSKL
ncbi:MAG: hypothetical protein H7A38_01945 [Chlamydiales bacterium]|nr:hypothetical protein [Chlamydiales bacterium]